MKYPGFYCDAKIDQSSWKFLHLHLVHQKFIVRRSLGQNWYYNQYWTGPPISKAEFHNKIIRRNYPPTRYTRVHGPPLFLVREIITLNIFIQYFTFSDKFLLVSSTVLITFKWDHIIIDNTLSKFWISNIMRKVLTWSLLTTERKLSLFTQFQVSWK